MRNIALIVRRELGAYFRTPAGYLVAAAMLLIDGLLFNAFAMGSSPRPSSEVLQRFFEYAAGTTMVAAVLLSMRLLAEDRQTGTLVLLFTSPVRESQVVIGKFVSALAFLVGMTLLTLYMPLMIFVNGKVSWGHIASGYLGLVLLGATVLALGVLGSALGRTQLLAGVISAVLTVTLLLCWLIARVADPPLQSIIAYMALFQKHFQPLQRGLLQLSDIVFFASVIYFALLAATRVLQSQRWR